MSDGNGWHQHGKIFVPDWTKSDSGVFVPFELTLETQPPKETQWYAWENPGVTLYGDKYYDVETGKWDFVKNAAEPLQASIERVFGKRWW